MRQTQIDRRWRSMTDDWHGEASLETLELRSFPGFGDADVKLGPGLALLVGINSAGKSRLLQALAASGPSGVGPARLTGAGISDLSFTYVDFFELMGRQWRALSETDLADRVEAAGQTEWRPSAVSDLSMILGRTYRAVWIAELDATGPVDEPTQSGYRPDVVPYFSVEYEDVSGRRGSEELSRGELSALTLLWVLETSDPGEMLLLDEPDQMLSPMAADRAMSKIVVHTGDRRTPCLVASHAYAALANAPTDALCVLTIHHGVTRAAAAGRSSLWEALRVAPQRRVFFVVEDHRARELLNFFLAEIQYPLRDVTDILIAGGEGVVRKFADIPVLAQAPFVLAGVFDGDQDIPKKKRSIHKLPGSWAPEQGAIAIASQYGEVLGVDPAIVSASLARSAGRNYHDVFDELATDLGTTQSELLISTWKHWVRHDDAGLAALLAFKEGIMAVAPADLKPMP